MFYRSVERVFKIVQVSVSELLLFKKTGVFILRISVLKKQ